MPYYGNIIREATYNEDLTRVLATGTHSQVELISLKQGEEIGQETLHSDEIFVGVTGQGQLLIDGAIHQLGVGDIVLINAGSSRNLTNHTTMPFKAYTIYSAQIHPSNATFKTEQEEMGGGTF